MRVYNSDKYAGHYPIVDQSQTVAQAAKQPVYNHQKYVRGPVPPGYLPLREQSNRLSSDRTRIKSDGTRSNYQTKTKME